MKISRRVNLITQDWFSVIIILCGVSLASPGCTTFPSVSTTPGPPVEKKIPPSDSYQEVESQLLATVRAAEKLGEGNPLLLSSLYSLATFYQQQGEFDKAEIQYKRALAIKEKQNGPQHPDVAIILKKYAELLRLAHRDKEADQLSLRAQAIMAKHSPPPP